MGRRKNSNWLVKALAMACGAISIALMTYANTYAASVPYNNQQVHIFNESQNGWYAPSETGRLIAPSSWVNGHRAIIGLGTVPKGSKYFSGKVNFQAQLYTQGIDVNDKITWYLGTSRGMSANNLSCYFSTGAFWTFIPNSSFDVDFFVEYHGVDTAASPVNNNQAYYSITALFHGESTWSGGEAANFVCELYSPNATNSNLFYQNGSINTYWEAGRVINNSPVYTTLEVTLSRDATDAINNVNSTLIEGFGGLENKLDEIQNKEENAGEEQIGDAENKSDEAAVDVEQPKMQLDILLQLVKTTGGSCSLGEIEAYGFNIGEIDMCTYTPPDWTRTAVSAVTSLALIYGYLHAFRRIIDTVIRGYTR